MFVFNRRGKKILKSMETWDSQVFIHCEVKLRFQFVDNVAEKEDDVEIISKLNAVFGRTHVSISAVFRCR